VLTPGNLHGGTHIRAKDYDRELTDVFAIQEDIAHAITGSLNMSLGLHPGDKLVYGTQSRGVYQDYLQAKAWLRDHNSPRSDPSLEILESMVERAPGGTPAWATQSRADVARRLHSRCRKGQSSPRCGSSKRSPQASITLIYRRRTRLP